MVAKAHTQSLASFQETATATLDRLNRTGESEILTVNGEARAVLVPPEVFDDMNRNADRARLADDEKYMAEMALAIEEARAGKGLEPKAVFADIRKALLERHAAKQQETSSTRP